jgi:hypothetical protein
MTLGSLIRFFLFLAPFKTRGFSHCPVKQAEGSTMVSIALGGTPQGLAEEVDLTNKRPGSKTAGERGEQVPNNIQMVLPANVQKAEARKYLCESVTVFQKFWEEMEKTSLWPSHFLTIKGRRMIDKIKTWNTLRRQKLSIAGTAKLVT